MFDFHVHTNFSDDSSTEMESYIDPALQKGLKGICFTDHIDIDYPGQGDKFMFDYAKRTAEINRLREKYMNQIEIMEGIEFGMQPHILDMDVCYFQSKTFDYVLGSLHSANKKDLYSEVPIDIAAEKQLIQEYFEDMLFCVKSYNSFHNLGHLDAIARYVRAGSFAAIDYMDRIEEILKALIARGKGIELNTSGRRYGLPDFHPEEKIVKLYKQLGGEIITLGSDAHNTSNLAHGFSTAKTLLEACGFKYSAIYRKGIPEFIRL